MNRYSIDVGLRDEIGCESESEELRIQSLQTEPTKKILTIYYCGKCHDHIWLLAVGHVLLNYWYYGNCGPCHVMLT
jgi:hypothetical protein